MPLNRGVHVSICALAMGLLVFLLATASAAFAQRVQSGSNSCSWTKSCTVSFSSSVSAGDAIAAAVTVSTWETGPQVPVLADTQGDTFTLVNSVASTFLFCAPKAVGGADSVSSSIAIAQVQAIVSLEFQGTCSVDQSTSATGSSTSAATPSIAVQAGDFLVAAATSQYRETFKASPGFTVEPGPGTLVIADAPQSAAGYASVTFTLGNSTGWTALLVAFSSTPTATFNVNATLSWNDGTPVARTVTISQQVSANPLTLNSLGSFTLNSSGVAQGPVTINTSLPLTFLVTLVNPSGSVVNSINLFASSQILQTLPHTLSASIVLSKADGSVMSASF